MYIEKIQIDSFGKLSDMSLELAPGVNIIEGRNESGKSTLAAFIKFMFYGMPPRERHTAASWQTGGLSGSITVNDGKKRFRIERSCVANRETVQMIDGDINMPMRGVLDDITPGELFFGVGADMFEATAFISQLGGVAAGGAKVSEGIENILFSADESVNTQRALSKIDSARAALLHKNEKGGRLFELANECAAMEVRLSEALAAHDEILSKQAQLAEISQRHNEADKNARELGAKVEQFETKTLLELFSRAKEMGAASEELRSQIEKNADVDVEAVKKLESDISRLELLQKEADEANRREHEASMPNTDSELEDYLAIGGRAAVEARRDGKRAKAKAYTAVGIVTLIMGLALIALGAFPLVVSGAPKLVPIVAGAAVAALAVTLFVLASRARAYADDIDAKYDFDALEGRIRERTSAIEEVKLASLAAINAARRLDEAKDEIKQRYSCEEHELGKKLSEQKEKLSAADSLRAQYDKQMSVLSQIKSQLSPYDEAELKDKLDLSVDISELDAKSLPELRREAEFSAKMAASLEKHTTEIEKTLAGLYASSEEPTAVSDRLSELKAERERLTKLHAAYVLATKKLSEASDSLRDSVSPRLASDTAQLMAHITGGKYKTVGVGTGLELCVETENGTKSIDVLSAGTQDAAYLCLRMALVSLLYRKELPPMLYDEAFVRQDDKRLSAMLKLLCIGGMQSLVFTANQRESQAMGALGSFNLIQI